MATVEHVHHSADSDAGMSAALFVALLLVIAVAVGAAILYGMRFSGAAPANDSDIDIRGQIDVPEVNAPANNAPGTTY